jgi:hypothetical protein
MKYVIDTSVTSHMGLMPELERAWISIDHKLFLWDYNDGWVAFCALRNQTLTMLQAGTEFFRGPTRRYHLCYPRTTQSVSVHRGNIPSARHLYSRLSSPPRSISNLCSWTRQQTSQGNPILRYRPKCRHRN